LDAFQAISGGTLLDAPVHGPMATSPLVLVSARHARYFSALRNEFGSSLVSGVSIRTSISIKVPWPPDPRARRRSALTP